MISFSETGVSDGSLFLPCSDFPGDSAPEGRASKGPGSLLAAAAAKSLQSCLTL